MNLRYLSTLAALVTLSALPAQAISVTWDEESGVRQLFTVIWGEDPFDPASFLNNGSISDAGASDLGTSVSVDLISSFTPGNPADLTPYFDGFDIIFGAGTRLFSDASLSGFAGVSVTALAGQPYGAQVLYGTPLPGDGGGNTTVPDAGSTLGYTLLAACGLFALSRTRSQTLTTV